MTKPPPKSARYVQVRDLLEQAAQFHGRMAEFYHRLSDHAGKERVKLLLDYMSTHEKNLQNSLDDFDEEASEGVLDTWVDRDHCDRIIHACENLPAEPELSIDGVTRLAMRVDESLIRFYDELARKAEGEDVREVFRNLVAQEQAELRRLARDALMVGDF
jgi:rubrerythrin